MKILPCRSHSSCPWTNVALQWSTRWGGETTVVLIIMLLQMASEYYLQTQWRRTSSVSSVSNERALRLVGAWCWLLVEANVMTHVAPASLPFCLVFLEWIWNGDITWLFSLKCSGQPSTKWPSSDPNIKTFSLLVVRPSASLWRTSSVYDCTCLTDSIFKSVICRSSTLSLSIYGCARWRHHTVVVRGSVLSSSMWTDSQNQATAIRHLVPAQRVTSVSVMTTSQLCTALLCNSHSANHDNRDHWLPSIGIPLR